MNQSSIKAIAFDLDDTLMDTTGLLVTKAAKSAFEILIKAGLQLTLDQCEKLRQDLVKKMSHKEAFSYLAQHHGQFKNTDIPNLLQRANKAFYEPELPEKIPTLDGVLENLNYLKNKYSLYVVTAGYQSAQQNKVKALGIENYFKKVFVVNSLEKERKIESFKKILELESILPLELLCIGNSLSSEIKDAKLLGAKACYFEFGEDRGSLSSHLAANQIDAPDYHIFHHKDFIATCQL